jgi:DTW domain-containing protein
MQIILLTHERELERPSNTGRVALAAFPGRVKRLVWSRTRPDPDLMAALALGEASLLFPAKEGDTVAITGGSGNASSSAAWVPDTSGEAPGDALGGVPETLVILDATWQEARKMLRQSPYLGCARRHSLPQAAQSTGASQFRLRRNQIAGGLCTLECIIVLWRQAGLTEQAALLQQGFEALNLKEKSALAIV